MTASKDRAAIRAELRAERKANKAMRGPPGGLAAIAGPAFAPPPPEKKTPERLFTVGIWRYGAVQSLSFKGGSHSELRRKINPNGDPKQSEPGDVEGFVTDAGRFLSREAAVPVAVAAGQIERAWLDSKRRLLSSDIRW